MLRAPLSTTLAGKTCRQRPRLLTPRATHKFGPPGGKQSIHFAGMRRQQSRPRIEWLARQSGVGESIESIGIDDDGLWHRAQPSGDCGRGIAAEPRTNRKDIRGRVDFLEGAVRSHHHFGNGARCADIVDCGRHEQRDQACAARYRRRRAQPRRARVARRPRDDADASRLALVH